MDIAREEVLFWCGRYPTATGQVSEAKRKEEFERATNKLTRSGDEMFRHRQSCEECWKTG
jgi:hypothetical protein